MNLLSNQDLKGLVKACPDILKELKPPTVCFFTLKQKFVYILVLAFNEECNDLINIKETSNSFKRLGFETSTEDGLFNLKGQALFCYKVFVWIKEAEEEAKRVQINNLELRLQIIMESKGLKNSVSSLADIINTAALNIDYETGKILDYDL